MSSTIGKEVLIHNLSHSDLILGVRNTNSKDVSFVARPKFSQFNEISHQLYLQVKHNVGSLFTSTPHVRTVTEKTDQSDIPIGYKLNNQNAFVCDAGKLRFREEDKDKVLSADSDHCLIDYVYFPLISVLAKKWVAHIEDTHKGFQKVILLVSGRGKPIDTRANDADNSTEFTAKLISIFIKAAFPDIKVEFLHSNTNLFRYDENIVFIKHELLPKIDSLREEYILTPDGKWKEKFKVTLSFADGSSARISAINASLKLYRPAYMHFWVLKSFWREKKVYYDDVEWHSFEEIATEPAIPLDGSEDPHVQRVSVEMVKFKNEIANLMLGENDLNKFWLRKTKKMVLAVLLVEKEDGTVKVYRGTNMEVSMPTGSLCAERNVIGSALADDITLLRQDIKVVAVYGLPSIEPPKRSTPLLCLPVATATTDDINKSGELSLPIPVSLDDEMPPTKRLKLSSPNTQSMGIAFGLGNHLESSQNDYLPILSEDSTGGSAKSAKSPTFAKRKIMRMTSTSSVDEYQPLSPTDRALEPEKTEKLRKSPRIQKNLQTKSVTTEAGMSEGSRTKSFVWVSPFPTSQSNDNLASVSSVTIIPTTTTIMVDENDMNPIKPCGACNEWLKKIAEVNPRLKVVTFTDASCKGIYVENIND